MPHRMQIGKVAQETGLSIDTIRFYEKEGLLREPTRTEGGFRLYVQADVQHLQFIKSAQELGFTLNEIRDLLLVQDERIEACTHVRDRIEQKLSGIRQKVESLRSLERHLEGALSKCNEALQNAQDPHHECCPVLEEISHVRGNEPKT
jgi:Predicted transcriptional regulators